MVRSVVKTKPDADRYARAVPILIGMAPGSSDTSTPALQYR
jgi:hypothetical protein